MRGLILVEGRGKILYVVNPATARFSKVMSTPGIIDCSTFGFGFNRVFMDYVTYGVYGDSILVMNPLNLNIWQEVGAFNCEIHENSCGVFFNDAIHFLGEKEGVCVIAGFRVSDREFFEFATSPGMNSSVYAKLALKLMNDLLCIVATENDGTVHIFVMLDYGRRESWRKVEIGLQFIEVADLQCGEECSTVLFFKMGAVFQGLISLNARARFFRIPITRLPDESFLAGPVVSEAPITHLLE